MTEVVSSFGTLMKLGDGGTPETFTTIAEVGDIDGPDLKLETEDATNHSSTDGWVEKIGTLLDGGQITFPVNFLPANATQSFGTGLIKDMVNRTKRNFKIVFPNVGATTWTLTALVVGFKPRMAVKGKMSADVTLEVTGKPTLA